MLNKPYIPKALSNLNIIPINANSKKPALSWEKFQHEGVTPGLIENWKGNFAVICGAVSDHLIVVDIDSEAVYNKFFQKVSTLKVKTPGGGCHLYFKDPSFKKKIPHFRGFPIDLQGEGSYVLIPPSKIEDKPYTVIDDKPIFETDVIALINAILPPVIDRPKNVQEFKKSIDISAVIQAYVPVASEGRGYWQGLCCFHDERSPSLTVYEENYYCFGCGVYGDAINFVMEVEHIPFKEAIDFLSSKYGVASPMPSVPARGYFDEEGKANYEAFVEGVIEAYHFVTTYDNEEVFWYCDGYYREGAIVRIKEWVETTFKDTGYPSKSHFVGEVVEAVKRRTYKDRGELTHAGKINLLNGILDIETKTLSAHTPEEVYLYQLPVKYEPRAKAPTFEKFLREVLKPEDIGTVKKMFGYTLLEDNRYQRAFLLMGEGCNGKTTLLNILEAMLGRQSIANEPLQSLASGRFSLASLYGKLANICADIPDKPLDYTGTFKMLTGGDSVKGERKYRDSFSFVNLAKLIFATNKLPQVNDNSPAFWRRWVVVEFPHSFEGREDRTILERVTAELSGVLNTALGGLSLLLLEDDFTVTLTMGDIMETWKKNSDSLYYYVSEMLEAQPTSTVTKEALYNEYCDFCDSKGLLSFPKNELGKRLPQRIRVRSVRRTVVGRTTPCWEGIAFTKEPTEEEEPED